jgi:hypothetical protein
LSTAIVANTVGYCEGAIFLENDKENW